MSQTTLDQVIDSMKSRILYHPVDPKTPAPIPWPKELAPNCQPTLLDKDGSAPKADVVILTWTSAEATALSDILTPGAPAKQWKSYTKNWNQFEGQLTHRSPALETQRLGSMQMIKIGKLNVLCVKSDLHPATDAPTLPTAQLVEQIARESGCKTFITTGTAGSANDKLLLGDVNIATAVVSDFTAHLKGNSWSLSRWNTALLSEKQKKLLDPNVIQNFFAPNSGKLPKQFVSRLPQLGYGDNVSTDFFAIGTEDDQFGLEKYDPKINTVDMDDAAVAVGLQKIGLKMGVEFYSVRNCSDFVMKDGTENSIAEASETYKKYGQFTTWNSAVVCWALCAGL